MTDDKSANDKRLEQMDGYIYRFAGEWYRHPCFEPIGSYQGVSLGEMAEYALIPILLTGVKAVGERV